MRKKSMTEKKVSSKFEKENADKDFAKKELNFDAAEVFSHQGSFEKRIE